MTQPLYPLHESIVDRIDPEYAAYYNEHISNRQATHLMPVDEARKTIPPPGPGPMLPVAKTEDISIPRKESTGPDVKIRVFTPNGPKPGDGWPVLLYYHGGGWVLGEIDAENVVTSNLSNRAGCVVITTEYRLAPEDPFPAAVDDSWEVVLWALGEGKELLGLDTSRIATGGSSAGGNLAAIMVQRAVTRGTCKFVLQLLSVPVMDNTADTTNNASYKENEHVPGLPPCRMLWFRDHYLPNKDDWNHPEASPLFWEGDWSKLAPAVIVMGELDILRVEGEQFGKKLQDAGVPTAVHILKAQPHPFLGLDGVLEAGREAITLLCDAMRKATAPSI